MESTLQPVLVPLTITPERKAQRLREVLDAAAFGRGGPEHEQASAAAAAEALLELGFPHAFELAPEELEALRERRYQHSVAHQLFTLCFGVFPAVVVCAVLTPLAPGLWVNGSGGTLVSAVIAGVSAVVALRTAVEAWRINVFPPRVQEASALRLLRFGVASLALGAVDVAMSSLLPHWPPPVDFNGWTNAGWLVPFQLVTAVVALRRLR